MEAYDTLSEAVNDLQRKGYTHNFNIQGDVVEGNDIQLHPDDFTIDKIFRFEGDTDPGDENILYAISSARHNIKGLLVNAYGPYSDSISAEMVSKLSVRK